MAWIELHQSVARHEKTYALARILSQKRPMIIGMLSLLWLWALDNRTAKVNLDPASLGDIMGWEGDKDLLLRALIETGWLDQTDTGIVIHHWDDYVGKLLVYREANRKRQANYRLKLLAKHDVTVMSQLRNGATVPTVPTVPTIPTLKIKNINKEREITKTIRLPGWIPQSTWDDFLEARKVKRNPATIAAQKIILSKLARFKEQGQDPVKILEQTIVGGWTSVYPIKENGSKNEPGINHNDPDKFIKGKYGHMVQR